MSHAQLTLFAFDPGPQSCQVQTFEAECRDLFFVIGTHDTATALAALVDCLADAAISVEPEQFVYGYYVPVAPPHPDACAEWAPADASDPYAVPGIAWHF